MQAILSTSDIENGKMAPDNVDHLMDKLHHFQQRSEELMLINQLHSRLAGIVDLQSIIEAFSIWLMPLVEHDLVAYQHPEKEQARLFCSCHGPDRREVIQITEQLFARAGMQDQPTDVLMDGYFVKCWQLPDQESKSRQLLLLLRKNASIPDQRRHIVDDAVALMQGPLQRAVYYEQLVEQASRDTLTGLANRRVFEQRIDSFTERAKRQGSPLTLASMDLDNFKKINDTMGHAEGDRVLRAVARTLASAVRGSDLLVRMGGDEFFLVLPDASLEAARNQAERLCRLVREMNIKSKQGERLGVSIGLAQWQPGMDREEWIQQADETLYRAKSTGRSRVCVSDVPSS